jgi:hypothetical protein
MGTKDKKLLDEIAAAAAERGVSLEKVLKWIKKHSLKGPAKIKIDTAIDIRNFYEKNKKLTKRQIIIKFSQSPEFKRILDNHFTGKKRKAFDDKSWKEYNERHHLADQELQTVGNYKKFKFIENQLLKPLTGKGIVSAFWKNTVPSKLITKPKKKLPK